MMDKKSVLENMMSKFDGSDSKESKVKEGKCPTCGQEIEAPVENEDELDED